MLPLLVTVPAFRPPAWAENTFRVAAEAAVTGSVKPTARAELATGAVTALAAGLVPVAITARRTAKAVLAALVPLGVVTVMLWVALAPAGTTKVRVVAVTLVGVTATPFTLTLVAPVRLVPVRVTGVPATPLAGLKLVIVGGGGTTVITSVPLPTAAATL